MLVDRVMRSNAVFLVSGFRCECLLPNKEEKSEEAWEPVFSFGHFDQAWRSMVWSVKQLFSSLGKLKQLKKNNRKLNQAFIARVTL